jgi:hypothetical protein
MDVHGDRESPLHEPSVIRLRAMIWFFVWFFIVAIVIHVLVYALYRIFVAQAADETVPITALSGEVTRSIPPEPRLQPSVHHDTLPRVDMDNLRARDLAEFRRRGWASEKGEEVIIPQRIIDQVAQLSQPATYSAGPATRSTR